MLQRRSIRALLVLGLVWGLVALTGHPALALTPAPDQTWRTHPNDKGFALAQAGTTIYVGGKITEIRDETGAIVQTASALVAVDAATGQVIPSFDAQIAKATGVPEVRALAVSADGSTLYVGGKFDTVGGQPHKNWAAVDATTGAVLGGVSLTANKPVKAILVGPDKVYLGGDFTKISGTTRTNLAAMLPDGSLDPAWLPTPTDGGSGAGVGIFSLEFAPDGGATIFVGGRFRTMNGAPRMAVARVTSSTGALDPWTIPPGTIDTGNQAWDLLVTPTRLFGGFGNGPNYVSAFRMNAELPFGGAGSQVWKFNVVGNVQGLALHPNGTQMFVAGHFGTASLQQTVCGNQNLRGLMLVHTANSAPPTGRVDCGWLPQITPFGSNFHGAWPLVMTGTQLWAGVKSKTISGVTQSGYARWTL